jgi:DNA primase
VRKFGASELQKKIADSLNLIDYKLKVLKNRFNIKQIQDKARVAGFMLETIGKFKNAVLKSEYIRKLSSELDVKEDSLWQELKKNAKTSNLGQGLNNAVLKTTAQISPAEKLLVKLLLEEEALIERLMPKLAPNDFRDSKISGLISLMFEMSEQGKKIAPHLLLTHFSDDEISQVICEPGILPEGLSIEHKEKMADDCIQRIKLSRLKERRHSLHEKIKQAQESKDAGLLKELLEEFDSLIKERKE